MSLSLLRSALIACQASLCRTNERLAVARPQVLALPSFLLNTDCRTHIDEDIVCKVAVPMNAVAAHVNTLPPWSIHVSAMAYTPQSETIG